MKIPGEGNNYLRNADDTTLTAESKEELKSLFINMKEENEKAGWKINISKIMTSGPIISVQFSSVQSLSHVQLFATPWNAARQASLSIANSQSLFKLMSIESVMPSNHFILCHPLFLLLQSFPASESFLMSQLFPSGGQNIGTSPSTSVLPMNILDWFPLGLINLISFQSKGLTKVFIDTTVQKPQFFSVQLFLWSSSHIHIWILEKP